MTGLSIGLLIFLSYTLVALNTIAIAGAKYKATAITSGLFMLCNFFLIKHVSDAKTTTELLAYIIGGVAGDLSGIYISKKLNIRA